jgi:hypothetical protein
MQECKMEMFDLEKEIDIIKEKVISMRRLL